MLLRHVVKRAVRELGGVDGGSLVLPRGSAMDDAVSSKVRAYARTAGTAGIVNLGELFDGGPG